MSPDSAMKDSMPLDERRLADLSAFEDLNETQLRTILDSASVVRVKPNATYFDEGDAAEHFYVLLDGVVRVVRTTSDGEQVVVLHIFPGQLFGIAPAFDNATYSATAKAASEVLALSWPSDLWNHFVKDYPAFQSATRRALGNRLRESQDKIVEMATLQVEQRIATAIARLVQQAGRRTEQGVEFDFPITRQDISEMTGTTLHSVSRYMSKWQKSGIVGGTRRRVIVRRPEDLPV